MSAKGATHVGGVSHSVEGRLAELDERKKAYETLDSTLEELPKRTRQKALVPLGPRLYARGELVRTNEVLVLLGRSGDETLFAERSSHQARQIVQRRIDAVLTAREHAVSEYSTNFSNAASATHVAESHVPKKDLEKQEEKKTPGGPALRRKGSILRSPSSSSNISDKSSGSKKKVHFADEKVDRKTNLENLPSKTYEKPASQRQSAGGTAQPNRARSLKSELWDAIQGAEQRVKDDNVVFLTEIYSNEDDKEPSHVDIPSHFRPDEQVSFADDSEEFLDVSGPSKQSTFESENTPRHDAPIGHGTVRGMSTNSVNESVNDDDEGMSSEDRDLIFQGLLEAERAFEEEEKQAEAEKKRNALRQEEGKFGSGFARGFFSEPKSSKSPVSSRHVHTASGNQDLEPTSNTTILSVEAPLGDNGTFSEGSSMSPEPLSATSDQAEMTVDGAKQEEAPVVQDFIVERRTAGGRRRKGSRFRTNIQNTTGLKTPAAALQTDDISSASEPDPYGVTDDLVFGEYDNNGARPISKFRQMRKLQRAKHTPL